MGSVNLVKLLQINKDLAHQNSCLNKINMIIDDYSMISNYINKLKVVDEETIIQCVNSLLALMNNVTNNISNNAKLMINNNNQTISDNKQIIIKEENE